MENTQEQKTPEMWFQKLKEPYRSEAIKGINKNVTGFKEYPKSLGEALFYCIYWDKTISQIPTRRDWDAIYSSILKGETTYLEPETLKPEQMESGKWYWVQTRNKFLIKFNCIKGKMINKTKCFIVNKEREAFLNNLCHINNIKSIKLATKEEVLKYFPDEVFEPIELRPEDLVSGEVYTLVDVKLGKFIFKHKEVEGDELVYNIMYCFTDKTYHINSHLCYEKTDKLFHATPEEKKLLLGEEEPTDWKSMYNELKTKYDQLEPKGEKVYFYWADRQYYCNVEKQEAIDNSDNFSEIYEAVCIGKKKSVLVNE